jgi:hypothetical protein
MICGLTYSTYVPYMTYNLQVHSGSNQFKLILKIAGHSGPLTRPSGSSLGRNLGLNHGSELNITIPNFHA